MYELRKTLDLNNNINKIFLDTIYLYVASENIVKIDILSGKILQTYEIPNYKYPTALFADSNHIYAGFESGDILKIDIDTGDVLKVLKYHNSKIYNLYLAISFEETKETEITRYILFSNSADGKLILYDDQTDTIFRTLNTQKTECNFIVNDDEIYYINDNKFILYDYIKDKTTKYKLSKIPVIYIYKLPDNDIIISFANGEIIQLQEDNKIVNLSIGHSVNFINIDSKRELLFAIQNAIFQSKQVVIQLKDKISGMVLDHSNKRIVVATVNGTINILKEKRKPSLNTYITLDNVNLSLELIKELYHSINDISEPIEFKQDDSDLNKLSNKSFLKLFHTLKWLSDWVTSNTVQQKYLNYIPTHVEYICQKFKRDDKVITLFRGTHLESHNIIRQYNENEFLINFNNITSWTSNLNIARNFQQDNGYILSLDMDSNNLFCDLQKLNPKEQEVLLYPGKYKCKIYKFSEEEDNLINVSDLQKIINIDNEPDNEDINTPNIISDGIGEVYKGSDGLYNELATDKTVYIKLYDNPLIAFCHHLANMFYKEVGIDAPTSKVMLLDNKYYYISEFIQGRQFSLYETLGYARKFADGIIYDLYILNFNVLGFKYSHVLIYNNKIYRINNKNSFLINNQGTLNTDDSVFEEWIDLYGLPDEYIQLLNSISYDNICQIPVMEKSIKNIEKVERKYGGWKNFIEMHVPKMDTKDKVKIADILANRLILLKKEYEKCKTSELSYSESELSN